MTDLSFKKQRFRASPGCSTTEVELLGRETRNRFNDLEELLTELPEKVAGAVARTMHPRLSAIEADVEALKSGSGR